MLSLINRHRHRKSSTTTKTIVTSESPTATERAKSGPWTLKNPKVKKFRATTPTQWCQKAETYQMRHLVQTSGAAEGKDPLERQEDRLVSGSLRLVSGLKKEGGDAIGLVGETKREATLTTSTSTGRRRSRTTIWVGEISKLLPGR